MLSVWGMSVFFLTRALIDLNSAYQPIKNYRQEPNCKWQEISLCAVGTLTYRVISIKRIRLGQEKFENRTVKKVFDTRIQVSAQN